MAEQEELKIVISAETVDLVKTLAQAGSALTDFGKDGKFSIDSLNNALVALRKAASASTDVQEIKRLGKAYSELQAQASKLNDAFNNLENGTRRSRIAVYSLNQVVRDAPFGFIAISNNIPVLIDQFQALVREERSVSGAFKSFASGLLGAGGVSIALSSIISLITTAVQKYGSLGKAYDALVTSNYALSQSIANADIAYQKFNESAMTSADIADQETIKATAQITRIKTLIDVINDNTQSYNRRNAAIEELKNINKDYFGNLDLEKLKIGDLERAYTQYINKIIAAAKAKGFEEELSKTNLELDKQQKLLGQLVKERGLARTRLRELSQQVSPEAAAGAPILQSLFDPNLEKAVQNQIGVVNQLFNRVQELEASIRETTIATLDYTNAQKGNTENAKTNTKTQKQLTKEIDKQAEATKKLAEQSLREDLLVLAAKLDAQKQYVKTLEVLDNDYLNQRIKLLDLEFQIKRLNLSKEIIDKGKLNEALLSLDQEYLNSVKLIYQQIQEARDKADLDAQKATQKSFSDLQKRTEEENKNLEQIYKNLARAIDSALTQSVNSLFDSLENGRSVFEGISLAIKRLVFELAAAVVKAAALAAVISVISKGGIPFSAAFRTALGGGGLGNILENLLPSAGFGLSAAPINGPGGFALSGQVVFVQRGADLVGVLNQTSARIGRVG